ncbi:putative sporulation protein YtxC [Thermoanaerobacterium thermosaccharolyticum]|uniref:putative sporulation protein YtxC n=1 Tax=Thermoanaerobacterium thermosaccharolyticum TaxID=1517 RepID=UPI001783D3E9|nr:putative sporulation protein YtxC [Thermoanaerobacterium thermosaccharolyticum]MBE0068881.1 putative sporulation protein YtxC [Thermoanaerobacterium thermosaccharolyticum]MBE0227112.1 putative sporulation protein YtxC [Thermoanaerobacterium thermosaccharolyticum]
MQLLSIGIPNALKNGSDFLKHGLKDMKTEGIDVNVNLDNRGNITFFNIDVEDKASYKNISKIRQHISDIISDIIVNQIDKKLIKKIIDKYYYYFNSDEKQKIANIANSILDNDVNRETFKLVKKEKIFIEIEDFLKDNETIDIEGFVNFRLRDFIGELSEVVDRAVDEYMMQKEYDEFIGLLKYFVELQDSKIDVLNILVDKGGKFRFFDKDNNPITGKFLSDITIEFSGGELSDDDMLISTLIAMAPAKIYIHFANNIKNKEVLDTVKKIFSDRVFICSGCSLCAAHEARK